MKRVNKIVLIILLLILAAMLVFIVWAKTPLGPMPEAVAAMQSNLEVEVNVGDWIEFRPTDNVPQSGFIIYPGGRVDPRSYAPIAREIAGQGYLTAIVPMPLNLAVFAPNKAEAVIDSHPEILKWAIGGHSLGGSMAANYAKSKPSEINGLVFWASYPPRNTDLSEMPLSVSSVYGDLDGLIPVDEILASRDQLPTDTIWVDIEGGNHAQFGWYGPQPGDNPAMISREEQTLQVVHATTILLQGIER